MNLPSPEKAPSNHPSESRWEKISLAIQLVLSFAVAGGVFFFLLWSGSQPDDADDKRPKPPEEPVRVSGPRSIFIKPGTPLDGKLDKNARVRLSEISTPILPVTGTVLASLRPGKEETKDNWQFASADLLQAFADWQRAINEVRFQKKQLELIAEMNKKRIERQEQVVARKKNLVEIGTETKEVLATEETNLIHFKIQERKEVYEQQTAVLLSERTEAILARQLQQNGLEPTMLRNSAIEGKIVVAEVPERVIRLVKPGMACKVEFFALPDHKPFTGKVSSIAPVISKEKRMASVQFTVKDDNDELRPGMYAKIGMGDERKALIMPADGAIHVGDHDYVLVAGADDHWDIFQVDVGELLRRHAEGVPGEPVKSDVEILGGYSLVNPARQLQKDDRVIGTGAILLKPVLVRALQAASKQ